MRKFELIARGLAPGVAMWLIFGLAVVLFGGAIPADTNNRENLLLFGLIAGFLVIKSTLMIQRMPYVDWLTISLAGTNYLLAVLYVLGASYLCWGGLRDPLQNIVQVLRLMLIVVLIWSTLLLAMVPDPIYEIGEGQPADV